MFYYVNHPNSPTRIMHSWPTLPINYRIGNKVYTRLPATHPNVRVGIGQPQPNFNPETQELVLQPTLVGNEVHERYVVVDKPVKTAEQLQSEATQELHRLSNDLLVMFVRLVEKLLANNTINVSQFSPELRTMFQNARTVVNKLDRNNS